jgi:hypothetical protein
MAIPKKEFKPRTDTTSWSIARQSQIKTMLDFSQTCGKCLDLKTLVGASEVLADWVVNGYSKEIGERLEKIQSHIDSLTNN